MFLRKLFAIYEISFFFSRPRTPPDGENHDTIILVDQDTRQKRAYNKKLVYDWKHEDTLKLIELWKGEESTYNKACMGYRDKSERARAYERIRDALDGSGISVSTDEIFSKMHSLRVYYCAKNLKAEEARHIWEVVFSKEKCKSQIRFFLLQYCQKRNKNNNTNTNNYNNFINNRRSSSKSFQTNTPKAKPCNHGTDHQQYDPRFHDHANVL